MQDKIKIHFSTDLKKEKGKENEFCILLSLVSLILKTQTSYILSLSSSPKKQTKEKRSQMLAVKSVSSSLVEMETILLTSWRLTNLLTIWSFLSYLINRRLVRHDLSFC